MKWLRKVMGKISDAIPNEITKTNSLTRWIPYVGAVTRGVSAVDNFGETYSNGGSFMDSVQWGANGAMGNSGDPNMFSAKNQPGLSNDWGDDWALNLGKMGNVYGNYRSGNSQSALGGIGDLFTKPGNESGETVFGSRPSGIDFGKLSTMSTEDPKSFQNVLPILQSLMSGQQSQNKPAQQQFPEVQGNEPRLDMGGSLYMEIPGSVYTADISGQLAKGPAPWMGIYG